MSEPKEQTSKQHYWLVPVTLIYRIGVTEKTRPLNVLLRTSNAFLNLPSIGRAQQLAQIQARETGAIPGNAQIIDAVLSGASYIGIMSDEEFNTPQVGQTPLFDVQPDDQNLDGTSSTDAGTGSSVPEASGIPTEVGLSEPVDGGMGSPEVPGNVETAGASDGAVPVQATGDGANG